MTKIIISEARYNDFDFAFEPYLEDVNQGYLGIGGNSDYNTHFSGLLAKVRKAVDTWGCYSFESVMDNLEILRLPASTEAKYVRSISILWANFSWLKPVL